MIFNIALKDLKVIARDKKALILLLIMPIVITFILGAAFGSSFSKRGLDITVFPVAVVDKDGGDQAKAFIEDFLVKDLSSLFTTQIATEEEAFNLLNSEKVSTVIVIPENFTDNINNGENSIIEIKSHINQQFNSNLVSSVVNGYMQKLSLGNTGANAAIETSQEYNLPLNSEDGTFEAQGVIQELQIRFNTDTLAFTESNQEKNKSISSIQYYSAAMLIMFLLFGALRGARMMIEERETRTLGRVLTTRANIATMVLGKFLGFFIICTCQALVLILFARFVYGVYWGSSILGFTLLTLSTIFAGSAFAMFLSSISKTSEAADGLGNILIQVFTVLGGGMIPVQLLPQFMQSLSRLTLNWWAMQGYVDLMFGRDLITILPSVGVLLLMGVLFLGVGITKLRLQ